MRRRPTSCGRRREQYPRPPQTRLPSRRQHSQRRGHKETRSAGQVKWARKTAHPVHEMNAQEKPTRTTTSSAEKRRLWLGLTSRNGAGHGDRALVDSVGCTCVARRGGLRRPRGEASRWIQAQFLSIQHFAMRLRQHLGAFSTGPPLIGPCWCSVRVRYGIICRENNSSVEPLGMSSDARAA